MHDARLPREAVACEAVTKRYPKPRSFARSLAPRRPEDWTEALRGVSLRIPRGTVHGLLGANGAGKTTLLKILSTLVVPTSGTARIAGFDVATEGARIRERLGLVLGEERSFHWRLSGRDNLLFFAALHDVPPRRRASRVDELLALVGLEADAKRPFREYSTGMRQRLGIARGLLAEPEVLLMDEPTRGLDPPSAAWVRRFVRERLVEARGVTVLLATHDLLEAETTCDLLSLVHGGRIVAEGTPAELRVRHGSVARTDFTFLAPSPELTARLVPGGLLPADAQVTAEGADVRAAIPGTPGEIAALVTTLAAAGAAIAGVEPDRGDLATVFERVMSPTPSGAPSAGSGSQPPAAGTGSSR